MALFYRSSLALVSFAALAVAVNARSETAQQAPTAAPPALEEITVTAERRPESLQSVPIAVTAITADSLKQSGVLTTQDLNALVPGLSLTTLSNAAVIFVRGVGTTNPVVGNESSVPVYIDGVYQPSFKGDIFSFNNIERVEVLKGPQGTLFGRNATGGAIQVITRDPSATLSADVGVGYESYDALTAKGYITGPIANGLNADFAAYYRGQTGTLGTNLGTGDQIGTDQEESFRTKWQWKPDDNTTVTASAQWLSTRGSEDYTYHLLPGSFGIDGRTKFDGNYNDTDTTNDPTGWVRQHAESLKIEHDFDDFNIVSISGDSGTRSYYYYDPDNTPLNILNASLPATENADSQEIQFLSKPDSPLKWILGGFYFHDVSKFPITLSGLGVAPLDYLHRETRGQVDSESIFAQATYPIFEDTRLTLGGRYNWDDIGYTGTEGSNFGTLVPTVTSSKYHTQPTYRVSLDHNFTPDLLGYISYNLGYKSGTFNLIDVPTEPATQPEILRAYETGIKTEFFDHRLRLNAAAFYYDYKNLQVLVNEGPIAVESNAPGAEIYGLDLDAQAQIATNLTAQVGLSALHDQFTDYPNATFYAPNPTGGNLSLVGAACPAGHAGNPNGCSAVGNTLPRVPNFTLDFGFTYDVPTSQGDVLLTVTDYVNGGFAWHADNYVKQGAYDTLNADVSWVAPDTHWTVHLYGRNLTDARYYDDVQESSFGFFGNNVHPLTVGGEVDYHY